MPKKKSLVKWKRARNLEGRGGPHLVFVPSYPGLRLTELGWELRGQEGAVEAFDVIHEADSMVWEVVVHYDWKRIAAFEDEEDAFEEATALNERSASRL